MAIEFREGVIDDPQVAALIAHHRAEALGATPAENAHALGTDGLRTPDVRFWSAWDGERLLGIGALRLLAADHAEVKSMRTAPAHLRRGVARAMLGHLLGVARTLGCTRVSLETGTEPLFDPATRMYEAAGFVDCGAFGGYPPSAHNRFMTRSL